MGSNPTLSASHLIMHRFLCLPLVCAVALMLSATGGCGKTESWTAIVYRGQTEFQFREVGVYPTVQDCLIEGKKIKGEGFLECGLNCRWDAQGMWQCEKTVRLMEHQLAE